MSFKKHKAILTGGILAVVLAASALGGSLSQAVTGDEYKSWKQYGSSWSTLTLGSSGESVARSGCAVTSAAMLMVQSGSVNEEDFTPGTLVSYMNRNGGFSSTGGINWNKLTGYAPSFTYCGRCSLAGTQSQKAARIAELLNDGYYVIAVVKNGGHFVAVDSVSGDSITMMDPGSRSTSLFEKYAASGLVSLRIFTGADSEVTAPMLSEITVPETTAAVSETTVIETTTVYTETAPETENEVIGFTAPVIVPEEAETEPVEETTEFVEETTTAEETTTEETTTTTTTVTETTTTETTETETVRTTPYISNDNSFEQAKAGLFQIDDQNLYMRVKFYTTEDIHLREIPTTGSDSLTIVPKGTCLDVVEVNGDFTWGRVAYNGYEGWVAMEYLGL